MPPWRDTLSRQSSHQNRFFTASDRNSVAATVRPYDRVEGATATFEVVCRIWDGLEVAISWLHVSDFHFKGGDPYDRDTVLKALVRSVRHFRKTGGAKPDLIFATGDIAHSGQESEYAAATEFFDQLLDAAEVEKRHLFIIPGNHDANQKLGGGLARTLELREAADNYFEPKFPKPHLTQKQQAFLKWHNGYFTGIRTFPDNSTCGPVEAVHVNGVTVGILPVNSALFCQDDHDHGKLWVGRRCLDAAIEQLDQLNVALKVALIHHPLDWLHFEEQPNIRHNLQSNIDIILSGHVHQTNIQEVVGTLGKVVHMVAAAGYQTRKWANRALYATVNDNKVRVFPICYQDQPHEIWTLDTSVFPTEPDYMGEFMLPRTIVETPPPPAPLPDTQPAAPRPVSFRSNVVSRGNNPFIGREDLFKQIDGDFGDQTREAVVVLHGPPGVGKSELAREFARRNKDRYPGGTFFIDAGRGIVFVDFARIGQTILGLKMLPSLSLEEQCLRTFFSLGTEPTLLIYDNVTSADAVSPYLPPSGMLCHVLITTVVDWWDTCWRTLPVTPLSTYSMALITGVAGPEVAERYGTKLAELAGGLPVQIVPASKTLAYEVRRGRHSAAALTLTQEARTSFLGVYGQLEAPAQILLHSTVRLNSQRISRQALQDQFVEALGWSNSYFQHQLDACLDLQVLQGADELRMHQLFATFLVVNSPGVEIAALVEKVGQVQASRLVKLARELYDHPYRSDLAAELMAFSPDPRRWDV